MRHRERAAAVTLVIHLGLAWAVSDTRAGDEATPIRTAPALTIKERLSGKASDDQRVDNCKVPVALRGPKPRPDACRGEAGAARVEDRNAGAGRRE